MSEAPETIYREPDHLDPAVRRVVEAYGGVERWRRAGHVKAEVRVGGLIPWLKMRRPPEVMSVRAVIRRPHVRLEPIDRAGHVGVLDGRDVRLEEADGTVIEVRPDARRLFPYGRRLFVWDALDLTYFLGYAIWQYVSLPALLMRRDMEWRTRRDGVLECTFPEWLPSHSSRQAFYYNAQTARLEAMEYVAEVLGYPMPSGVPVHFIEEHAVTPEGITYVSHRRAGPPWGLRLVDVRFEDWNLFDS